MDEPNQPAEPAAEAKRSRGFASYCVWGFVVVMVYVLSWGPVVRLGNYSAIHPSVLYVYRPLGWLHDNTPLRQPLRMYLQLWCPWLKKDSDTK